MVKLSNSPQETTIVRAEARKSFAFGLWLKDGNGNPVPLDDTRFVLNAAKLDRVGTATLVLTAEADIVGVAEGYACFNLQASALNLAAGEYPFSVTMIAAGYSTVLVKGSLEIIPNTDLSSVGSTYSLANPPQALEVVLRSKQDIHIDLASVPSISAAAVLELTDALEDHRLSPTPHPEYDDLPSLTLLFENRLI
jgi:hypothetical protein